MNMTGLERLAAALTGQPADRVPVFCNLFDQGFKELRKKPQEYYANGELVAEAQLQMRQRFGYDNVWSLFYVGKEAELLGCKDILYASDGPPNVADFVLKSEADIHALQIPDRLEELPAFGETRKCLEILKREVGGTQPVCAYITATMALPALLMGMERWMELLFWGPKAARDELLEKCHQFFVREVQAYRAGGADLLVYSNPFGSVDTVPMRFFRNTALPWIERDIQAVGTAGVVYYCGMARFNPVLDLVIERTGIGVYYLSPLDDLRQGKALINGRGLTCGVINDIALIDWSPAETRAEVSRMMAVGKPGGKFLFGTGVMPLSIPEANIQAMLDAAYELGMYSADE